VLLLYTHRSPWVPALTATITLTLVIVFVMVVKPTLFV
jgi:hypothetical protein